MLVGDGRERRALKQKSERLGLAGTVVFAGQRSDVASFYSLAQLVVLPSHTEGSPNVVLEALAAGVPIVATAVGGVPEILSDGLNGRLVPKSDAGAMAGAIAELLADRDLRGRLIQAGRETVSSRHSFAEYSAALVRCYEDALHSFGNPGGRRACVC